MSFPPGPFLIRNIGSNLVLDPGADVLVYSRTADSNQLWVFDSGYIVNQNSGLVLDVRGDLNGGPIAPGTTLTQSVRRDDSNQLWAYDRLYLRPYDPIVVVAAQGDNLTVGNLAAVNTPVDFPNNIDQQWVLENP